MEERRREMEEERSQETVTGCHAVVSGDSENVSVELISQSVKSTRHVDERPLNLLHNPGNKLDTHTETTHTHTQTEIKACSVCDGWIY